MKLEAGALSSTGMAPANVIAMKTNRRADLPSPYWQEKGLLMVAFRTSGHKARVHLSPGILGNETLRWETNSISICFDI